MTKAAEASRVAAIVAGCGLLIAAIHKPLVTTHHHVHETSDVFWLPPPDDVVKLSLGYRAALVDFIWAHILVEQGLHTFDKRRYDNLTRLLDTVNDLEPTFRDPYMLAEALITFQTGVTSEDEVRKARAIMERGARNRPDDAQLWVAMGSFVTFVAPYSYLHDPEEQQRWRREGAEMLARASELSGNNANIAWQALGGANVLLQAGENAQAIEFLEKTLATTDDEELKAKIRDKLAALKKTDDQAARALAEVATQRAVNRLERMQRVKAESLPFESWNMFLLLGPPLEPALCAGGFHRDAPKCAFDWRTWSDRVDAKSNAADLLGP